MRARRADFEGLCDWHEALALQRAANDVDESLGQMRQIAQGFVFNDAAFAVAAPQEVGAVDMILVFALCGDDVRCAAAGSHIRYYSLQSDNVNYFSDYIWK
jgi:hypothetical protein